MAQLEHLLEQRSKRLYFRAPRPSGELPARLAVQHPALALMPPPALRRLLQVRHRIGNSSHGSRLGSGSMFNLPQLYFPVCSVAEVFLSMHTGSIAELQHCLVQVASWLHCSAAARQHYGVLVSNRPN